MLFTIQNALLKRTYDLLFIRRH